MPSWSDPIVGIGCECTRAELWDAVTRVDRFEHWWPWLDEFDGSRLAPGETWSSAVRPPFRYVLRFRVHLERVEPPQLVTATITGDIVGDTRLTLLEDGPSSGIRLTSRLAPDRRALQAVARVARPVVRRGHDWVLDTGARQFAEQALPPQSAGPDATSPPAP